MKIRIAIIVAIVALSLAAFAQQPVDNPTPASRDQILKMMDAMQANKTVEAVMDSVQRQTAAMMDQQIQRTAPDAPPAMRAELGEVMQDMIKDMQPMMGEMMQEMIPIYQKHLSSKEADAITAFYLSPEGQSFLAKMPVIMNDSMEVMSKSMDARMQPIMEKMTKRIEEITKKYQPAKKPAPSSGTGTAASPRKNTGTAKPAAPATKKAVPAQ